MICVTHVLSVTESIYSLWTVKFDIVTDNDVDITYEITSDFDGPSQFLFDNNIYVSGNDDSNILTKVRNNLNTDVFMLKFLVGMFYFEKTGVNKFPGYRSVIMYSQIQWQGNQYHKYDGGYYIKYIYIQAQQNNGKFVRFDPSFDSGIYQPD